MRVAIRFAHRQRDSQDVLSATKRIGAYGISIV